MARKGVLLVFDDSFSFTLAVIDDLLEVLEPGENLDLVLVLTVSQPPPHLGLELLNSLLILEF